MDKVLDQVDALYEKAEISCEFCGEQIRDSYYQDHIKTQKHTKNEKRMKMLKLLEKGGQGTNPPSPHLLLLNSLHLQFGMMMKRSKWSWIKPTIKSLMHLILNNQ